jgi:hypothetical protein
MKHAVTLLLVFVAHIASALDVTHNGITITITGTPTSGTYVMGDPWVVGPVTITAISPNPTTGRNGYMVNPSIGVLQSFDDRITNHTGSNYTAPPALPLVVSADSSVVFSITSTQSTKPWLASVAILTVVSSPPAENSFRPGYIGTGSRASTYTLSDVDFNAFNDAPKTGITLRSWATVEANIADSWYEQDLTWTSQYLWQTGMGIYPGGTNYYGRTLANQTAEVGMMLNLDYTDLEKTPAVKWMVQRGLDVSWIISKGGSWGADGGHQVGRLIPLFVAGKVLGDTAMLTQASAAQNKFQEYQQTFFVQASDVAITHVGVNGTTAVNYTADDIGKAEWGILHDSNPVRDSDSWSAPYRSTAGGTLTGVLMTARLMGVQADLGASDALWAYAIRHIDYETSGAGYGGEFDSNATPTIAKQVYALLYDYPAPSGGSDTTDPVVSGVSVTAITSTTAYIEASATEGAGWDIELGTTLAYELTPATQGGFSATLSQTLSGLSASTLYYYRITATDAAANSSTPSTGTFTTASAGEDPAAAPTFSPDGASSFDPIALTISKTTGGDIEYSFDGVNFSTYSSPLLLTSAGDTTVFARVAAGGGYTQSPTVSRIFTVGELAISEQWQEHSFPAKTGQLVATKRLIAGGTGSDIVVMLAENSGVSAFSAGACRVRFYTTGVVQAIDGSIYKSDATFNWTQGSEYEVTIWADVTTDTYSVNVGLVGQPSTTIATDYAFPQTVTQLTTFAVINDVSPFDGRVTSFSAIEPGVARATASPRALVIAP